MNNNVFGSRRRQIQTSQDVAAIKGPCLREPKIIEPFYFIQAADSQFGLIDRFLKKLPKACWDDEIALSESLVAACNKLKPKPKFMIICGDLVDSYPYRVDPMKDERPYPLDHELREKQLKDFIRIFSKLNIDIPLVCLCGNHDIGDEPTLETVNSYKRIFGEDYFYFILNDVLFIVLNSQFYKHRAFVEDYAQKQDAWLNEILTKCKSFKTAIVFQHIPWFLAKPDEDEDYFNIEPKTRAVWLDKLKDAVVKKVMCGHYHRNAGGWHGDMELVVTSAIGAQIGPDLSGARLVSVLQDGSVKHHYYAIEDLPEQVQLD